MMKKCIFFFSLLFFSLQAHAHPIRNYALNSFNYIVCLDGGGSKTSLQILDQHGKPLELESQGITSEIIFGPSSNINTIGPEGFAYMLDSLFSSLIVGEEKIPFLNLQTECLVIGGIAGLASPANLEKAKMIFQTKGFQSDNLVLSSDIHLALELVDEIGIVLIAGTGSIAIGTEEGKEIRAGGFGRLLGDEGSGYAIGIRAIQSALEDEFGYGKPTSLREIIKNCYHVEKVRDLIPSIYSDKITPTEIAQLAPHVFASSKTGDQISNSIIIEATQDLSTLVYHVLSQMHASSHIPLVLMGGLFQGYPLFAQQILQSEPLRTLLEQEQKSIRLCDLSGKNLAVQVVQKSLNFSFDPKN